MSPHRIDVRPSLAALNQYGISKNGFLPAEPPLTRLPHAYYQPWESIIEQLPMLIEEQSIRLWVDSLPVLSTKHLQSEPEWQRAHSLLALLAQGYIWAGPEPSEVGVLSVSYFFAYRLS
jgi:indoleamine 2,3-dioxygenase